MFADSNAYPNTFLMTITLEDGETKRLLSEGHDSKYSISVGFQVA